MYLDLYPIRIIVLKNHVVLLMLFLSCSSLALGWGSSNLDVSSQCMEPCWCGCVDTLRWPPTPYECPICKNSLEQEESLGK